MRIIKRKINLNLSKEKFFYYLNFINEKEKDKILKYKRYEDSLRSLYSKVILKNVLKLDKIELEYNEWKKPRLLNNSKIHFNVSHSGEWVVVGIASNPIGVDIEKIHKIDLSIAKRVFSKTENEYILSLSKNNRMEAFFMLWTLKEAFIKAKGMGLYMPLNSFTINMIDHKPILLNDKYGKCKLSVEQIEKDYFMSTCVLKN